MSLSDVPVSERVKQHLSTHLLWFTISLHVFAAYLSSFWKVWSPSSRSLKRKRGGSGGTSLSTCSILRVEMSKITPLLLLLDWSGAGAELEEGEERSKETVEKLKEMCKVRGVEQRKEHEQEERWGTRKGNIGWKSASGGLIHGCRQEWVRKEEINKDKLKENQHPRNSAA